MFVVCCSEGSDLYRTEYENKVGCGAIPTFGVGEGDMGKDLKTSKMMCMT